jgi:NTE family protein
VEAKPQTLKIGLALGGGAARGLAHIPMLEAFDELGLKPAVIAGSSMGALVGAAYASGYSARDLRQHALSLLSKRMDMVKHIFGAKKLRPQQLLSLQGLTSLHLEGQVLADIALPDGIAKTIEETIIPLKIIATDYVDMIERVMVRGSMLEAVGASIAIPGLVAGPVIDGHVHVDGGVTNPVPFDHVRDGVDFVVAIDVTGKPKPAHGGYPSNIELAIGSLLIMFHQQAELRRALNPPDIYITPDVDQFGSVDFFRVQEIFAAAGPAKERLKRSLDLRLSNAG